MEDREDRASRANRDHCFYCNRYARVEQDHFPVPKAAGGESTVPACLTCHDELDRTPLDYWNVSEAFSALKGLWSKAAERERLMLAKLFKVMAHMRHESSLRDKKK